MSDDVWTPNNTGETKGRLRFQRSTWGQPQGR